MRHFRYLPQTPRSNMYEVRLKKNLISKYLQTPGIPAAPIHLGTNPGTSNPVRTWLRQQSWRHRGQFGPAASSSVRDAHREAEGAVLDLEEMAATIRMPRQLRRKTVDAFFRTGANTAAGSISRTSGLLACREHSSRGMTSVPSLLWPRSV
jgi:hypothetical protein